MEDEDEEQGGAGWLVSFADLMTLLFAAFVVLYGITPRGKSDQVVGIATSVREAFVEIPDDIEDPTRSGEVYSGKMIFQEVKREKPLNPLIKKFNRNESKIRGRDKDLQQMDILLDKSSKGKGIQFSLRQAVEVSDSEFGFNLKLLASALFIPGTNKLTKEARKEMPNLIQHLSTESKKIFVEGHVDQSTPKGRYTHLELSALRAKTIRNLIIQNSQVDPKKVYTASYGASRPVDSNRTPQGRAKNSRVEIKILYQE